MTWPPPKPEKYLTGSTPTINVTQVISASCKAVIRKSLPAREAGRDKSSSSCATQSSSGCIGTRSASSESPNDSASNGWSDTSTVVSKVGQLGRVHGLHGEVGALESPSVLLWSRTARCTIENWNCCRVYNHQAIMPSVSLKRCSHTRDLWSVWSVNLAPWKYERNCIHMETAVSISLTWTVDQTCD